MKTMKKFKVTFKVESDIVDLEHLKRYYPTVDNWSLQDVADHGFESMYDSASDYLSVDGIYEVDDQGNMVSGKNLWSEDFEALSNILANSI